MSFSTDPVVEPQLDFVVPAAAPLPLPAADAEPAPLAGVPTALRPALERRGFAKLTFVQEAVLRAQAGVDAAHARDLRISSQTGSGKTVAIGFALAPQLAVPQVASRGGAGPSVLVIVPTRELADQVRKELEWLFADLRVRLDCVTGGTSVVNEQRRLQRNPHLVVGTPGRLLDHIKSGALVCSAVRQLVLDEADQMLDMGFRDDLDAILAALPAQRRTHMVSATFPPEVQDLVAHFQSQPLVIEGTRLGLANADIEHQLCRVHARERYAALVNLLLLQDGERTLVFVRTRQDSTELAERLAKDGFGALPLSGELAQAQRTRTLDAFRRGVVTTLVATDVAARGLDVPEVNVVVHFDLPIDDGVYTHRSGRTGRAGRKGKSIVLVAQGAGARVQRMLRAAKVTPVWSDAPSVGEVHAALAEGARRRMAALLDAPEPPADADCDAAREVLAGRDPVQVVARLLASTRKEPVRAPMVVTAPASRPTPEATFFRAPSHTLARDERFAPRVPYAQRRPRLPGTRGPRAPESAAGRAAAYVRFAINWGTRKGATPQRLLAHVCRRGDIAGHQIGVITVQPFAATFEVDAGVAAAFAARARRPDPREPHLVIERA
jgi:ATP-dependent RNA helicase DeaD